MKLKIKSFNKALFFILIPLILIGFLSLRVVLNQKTQANPSSVVKTSSLSPKPTFKPTPTPTPSPTPTPNYGYCLYVPVLFYHHVQPEADAVANKQTSESVDTGYFDRQMAYLSQNGYQSISALDLVLALHGRTGLPSKSVVVTLDDGYKDQFTNALPIARKYGIKLNLLIPSGLINNSGFMNWDEINQIKNAGGYIIDHTWSHYSINYASDEKAKYEIETAKSQIEQYTGQKVELFGYPYGGFNQRDEAILAQDGFLGAFTTLPGAYQCDSFIMALHRTRIGNAPLAAYGF